MVVGTGGAEVVEGTVVLVGEMLEVEVTVLSVVVWAPQACRQRPAVRAKPTMERHTDCVESTLIRSLPGSYRHVRDHHVRPCCQLDAAAE